MSGAHRVDAARPASVVRSTHPGGLQLARESAVLCHLTISGGGVCSVRAADQETGQHPRSAIAAAIAVHGRLTASRCSPAPSTIHGG
jgi:hypothetical protein